MVTRALILICLLLALLASAAPVHAQLASPTPTPISLYGGNYLLRGGHYTFEMLPGAYMTNVVMEPTPTPTPTAVATPAPGPTPVAHFFTLPPRATRPS